jgi:multidrug resistance efflux pump
MLFTKRLKARLCAAVPVLTLAGTLGLASLVYCGDDVRGGLVGFAQGAPEAVSALEPARVSSLHVAVGSEVEPGQLVATLDTSSVDAEIAIAHAERVRIEAAMAAERTMLGRRLDVDRETLEREATREREDLVRMNAESVALDSEIERVKKLVAEHQAVATDLAPMTLRRAQLASLATEKPRTLGILSRQLDAASRRRDELDDIGSTTAAKLDADLLVVQRRIDFLEKRRSSHLLRATSRGRVVSLDKQPGETATAGEPILKLVSTTHRVVVCVPERRSLGLHEGDAVRLWGHGQQGAPLAGRTVSLSPIVSELPPRCWPTPKLPTWGREITVTIDAPIEVVAGEAFDVVFDGPAAPALPASARGAPVAKRAGVTGTEAASGASQAASVEPQLMTVPSSLLQRTRFEPSGILARPSENRYLIVSDDTGIQKGADEGRPWLFSMDAAGKVDPAPIAIAGVSEIDDLESIAAGDSGEIYVLSSQSRNRKDRRKPARSALLRLRPEGGGFKVDGEVHLAETLELAPERAAALGLVNGTRSLDIEGMAFRGGALFFGLKAPLDAHGDAMIWKVATPSALFDASTSGSKKLERAGVALWGHARVDVEIDGRSVPGGISELLFQGDSLVITSTPSTADGAAGALWHVEHARGGALAARLVRRFPGRKPEGLSSSLTAGKLMLVFDAGSATPSFLEVPWPP